MSDALLARIQAGDADAFAAWLVTAEAPVRASLRRFAADVDTEAVVQEALLRAWNAAPHVQADGRGNSLLRYTLRVARNLAIDALRRRARAPVETLDADVPDVQPEPPDPLLRRVIARCVAALTGRPRDALNARLEADGRPDADLAAEVGMTLNTFLQNVTRARRALVVCLRRAGVPVPEEVL